uniref:Uncharacterized protein n=1 Tax=Rhizophora mucronata TaxID=61149 RepID=A0A2P2R3N4_RHIMU
MCASKLQPTDTTPHPLHSHSLSLNTFLSSSAPPSPPSVSLS